MKEFIIRENEAGQRFDKYLAKLLKEAPKSFCYKMLRKKNITLNGKKASGNEKLVLGDHVKLFLGDDTFQKFAGNTESARMKRKMDMDIVYEDRDVLLVNKPAGLLSQPDRSGEPSLVEALTDYLLETGVLTETDLNTFHPSVCNRLDRNTSGIVAAGKTLPGLQALSELFRERTVHKDYLSLAGGVLKEKKYIKGYLHKDTKSNKVSIYKTKSEDRDALPIETEYEPLGNNGRVTLLKIRLHTGRTHQIRAHLAAEGHPLVGDWKYGDEKINRIYRDRYHLKYQLLHALCLGFPEISGKLERLSGKSFFAEPPQLFKYILKEEHLEESYYENLERNMGLCKNDHYCGRGSSDRQ